MFRGWKKIDLALGVLFIITNLCFIFFSREVFQISLWSLIFLLIVRLLLILKKKLFWKVRNRLIFSSLFIVITPIIFLLIFFFIFLNVVIAQYGITIVDNIMNDRLNRLELATDTYFNAKNNDEMIDLIKRAVYLDRGIGFLNVVFFEKRNGHFSSFFKYPAGFNEQKIAHHNFRGYFLLESKLYHGIFKIKGDKAILFATTINQKFLDEFSTISDFRVKFQDPEKKLVFDLPKSLDGGTDDPTQKALFLPHLLEYKYLDFDNSEKKNSLEKKKFFLLMIDYQKTFDKIEIVNSSTPQTFIRKLTYFIIILFSTFILISFFIGFRMIRVVTKSIGQLTKGIEKIRKGDFTARVKIKSGDEIQYLGESFNEMASGINRLLEEEKEKHRISEELKIARSIQLKLLPPDNLETPQFELQAANIPATEIAGDFYDYSYRNQDSLSVVVADVSGKGASAAFYMAELKGLLNYLMQKNLSLSASLSECNDIMKRSLDKKTFITVNIVKVFFSEKTLHFARAGHTQAIHLKTDLEKCSELYPNGMALGLSGFSQKGIEVIRTSYKPGDIFFMFSDGLSEIMNHEGSMLGVEPLKKIIIENKNKKLSEIKEKILNLGVEFSGKNTIDDDLTFTILRMK